MENNFNIDDLMGMFGMSDTSEKSERSELARKFAALASEAGDIAKKFDQQSNNEGTGCPKKENK